VRRLLLTLVFSLAAAGPALAGLASHQRVLPRSVFLEPSVQGPILNFDVACRLEAACRPLLALFTYRDARGALLLRRRLTSHHFADLWRFLTVVSARGRLRAPGEALAPGDRLFLTHPYSQIPWPAGGEPAAVEVVLYLQAAAGGKVEAVSWRVRVRRFQPQVHLRLPVRGSWWNLEGHDAFSHHRHLPVEVNSNYFACDLVKVDRKLALHRGDGTRLEHYYSFGQPVVAAAEGLVVKVVDGLPDNPVGRSLPLYAQDQEGRLAGGNLVILEHGPRRYTYYAHLQRGSLQVREGQRVRRGGRLAAVGNSGSNTSVPHLHWHLMDAPATDFRRAQGLPAVLEAFRLRRGRQWVVVHGRCLLAGEVVRPLEE